MGNCSFKAEAFDHTETSKINEFGLMILAIINKTHFNF